MGKYDHSRIESRVRRRTEPKLVLAVKRGNLSELERIIQHVGHVRDVSESGLDGMCALHWAAKLGQLEMLKLLIPKTHLDVTDYKGRTALFYAIENDVKGPEAIDLLLEGCANAAHHDQQGKTALRLAAEMGKFDALRKLVGSDQKSLLEAVDACEESHEAENTTVKAVKALLDCGGNITLRTERGDSTALHIAAKNGCMAVVDLLKPFRQLIETRDSAGRTPLHIAAQNGRENVAKVLLEQHSAKIEAKADRNWTALHFAARQGNIKLASLLIERGADVTAETATRYTPVYLACFSEHDELATMFLDYMSKEQVLAVRNYDEEHLLWVAVSFNCFEVVKRLVQYAREDDIFRKLLSERRYGWTLVLNALALNEPNIARFLIENGASTEGTDVDGNTVLHLASRHGMTELLSGLLNGGSEANKLLTLKNHQGMTPLDCAATGHNTDVLSLLLKRDNPERVAGEKTNGWKALHWAAWYERLDLIRLLIAHGADLSATDDENRTPLSVAQARETISVEILEWLTLADVHNEFTSRPTLERPVPEPEAEDLCKRYRVHLMDFYPQSLMEKSKFTVYNVIYEYGPNSLMRIVADARGIRENLIFRWIHLPMNNKIWIKDLLQSMYFDQQERAMKNGHKNTPSGIRRIPLHFEPTPDIDGSSHSNSDADSDVYTNEMGTRKVTDRKKKEEEVSYHFLRTYIDNSLTQNVGGPRLPFLESHAVLTTIGTSARGVGATLSIPYFSFRKISDVNLQRQTSHQGLFQESEHTEGVGTEKKAESERRAFEVFDDCSLQLSLTLDEFYYNLLPSTEARNRDQVLLRYQDRGAHTQKHRNRLICMVDHLWLSIASDKTVVTSCSEESNGESTTIQDAIRNRCNLDRGKGPRVSFALGMIPLAIAVCCKQTIDLKLETGTGKENILQVFRSEIAKVVNREVELFDRFKACVDEASHLLLNDQMSRNGSLSEEIELLKEVKDILDELNIIYTVTSQQEYILDTAFDSLDGFDDQSEIAALLDYYRTFSNIYHIRKEVNKLIYDAKQIQKNINHLLDLRQKDANLSEAIWARNSAENTARQGRTILVFTVVTIIFLPITFLSSLFALNITSFPHDKDGSLSYSPQWAYSRLFGITVAVSVPLIVLAFFMGQISDFILESLSMKRHKHRNREIPDKKADVVTKAALGSTDQDEATKVTWRERILRRRRTGRLIKEDVVGV